MQKPKTLKFWVFYNIDNCINLNKIKLKNLLLLTK